MATRETYFDILGLPQRYHTAPSELEERYHAAARAHHPDRHVKSDQKTRVQSALRTAQLTEAYRTLRDPVKRAEYLVSLEGIKLSDERDSYKVDPAFLADILELRESLADARMEGDEARVKALGEDVRGRSRQAMGEIDAAFRRYDEGDKSVVRAIADALVAQRYYRRFLDELEAHEEARTEREEQL